MKLLYWMAAASEGRQPLSITAKMRIAGQLAEIYRTWMGLPLPEFPESLEGIPFTAS